VIQSTNSVLFNHTIVKLKTFRHC